MTLCVYQGWWRRTAGGRLPAWSAWRAATASAPASPCSGCTTGGWPRVLATCHVSRVLYRLGARSLTLTHNCNNPWADASLVDQEKFQPVHNGLTDFGKVRATRVTAAPQCTKRINFEIENEDVILPFYIEKLRNFVKVLLGTIPWMWNSTICIFK